MRLQRAYRLGNGDVVFRHLRSKLGQFGLDSMPDLEKKPTLVRVLDDDVETAEDLFVLGRDLNRTETMGFDPAEQAVVAGRAISDQMLEWGTAQMDMLGEDASVRDFMRARGAEIVQRMIDSGMIEPTKRAAYVAKNGEMTEAAKDLFEAAWLGKIVDDADLLKTTPKEILRKLSRAVPGLMKAKAAGAMWDISPEVKQALDLWKRIDSIRDSLNEIGTKADSLVDKYLHPEDFENGTQLMDYGAGTARETPHPTVEAIAKLLEKPQVEVRNGFADYGNEAEGKQQTLGPPPEPVESFNRFIGSKVGIEINPDQWAVPMAEAPKAAVLAPEKALEPLSAAAATETTPAVPPPLETTPRAIEPLSDQPRDTVRRLRDVMKDHPGIQDVADEELIIADRIVRFEQGVSFEEFLRQHPEAMADVRTKQERGTGGLEQSIADLSGWARRAGKKLMITPYGEQLGLFGGAEPQFILRNRVGDERLVLKSELMKLRDAVPRVAEMVDADGNVKQPELFGAEEENLFGPGPDEEEPQQGTLFQVPPDLDADARLKEAFAKSKSVGQNEADFFTKAKAELFPGKRELTNEEVGRVSTRAREMRMASEGPQVLFQEEPGPWLFKSAGILEDAKLPNLQGGDQWAALLKNRGVKADELKWLGVDDFLKDKKKVTKQELQDFIRENQFQVTEKALTLPKYPEKPIFDGAGDLVTNALGTKYSEYTLPGEKKNYTELLMTLPERAGGERGPKGWADTAGNTADTENFRTSHFEEPNILAHVRFDERTDSAGNRVLFVEEVQSDWHQKGKKVGYGDIRAELEAKMKPLEESWFRLLKELLRKDDLGGHENIADAAIDAARPEGTPGNDYSPETVAAARAWYALYKPWKELHEQYLNVGDTVPNAPFKSDWHELVMKRMLREAVERGYDKIAWVTGEQTAERYDLSKHIDSIFYVKHPDGSYEVDGVKDGERLFSKRLSEEELEGNVGKDVAKKIIDGDGDVRHSWKRVGVDGKEVTEKERKVLSGVDLKIGGGWAKNLYDRAIPNFMSKYGKKWGARVGETELSSRSAAKEVKVVDLGDGITQVEWRNRLSNEVHHQTYRDDELAERFANTLREQKGVRVHSLEITPEMRKSVMEGQPLFQAKRGEVRYLDDGRRILYLYKTANASTFLHEFAHIIRPYLSPKSTAILEKWLKIKDGHWSRNDEENFSRSFEQDFRQRKVENLPPEVRSIFKKIQDAMRKIYEAVIDTEGRKRFDLTGSHNLVKASKEVTNLLFDRWYGMEAPPEAPGEAKGLEEPPEAPKYKFGNTQANIPPSSAAAKALNEVRSGIADEDLAGKGKEVGDGGNHVTVRYGIQGEDTAGIEKFLSEQEPFEAHLGKTDKFPPSEHSDGAAVIVAPIEADELRYLNAELEKHGDFTEPSFEEYKPHATVAYVKPESADKYVGMDATEGKTFRIDKIAISKRDGSQEIVKLEGRPKPGEKETIPAASEMEQPPLSTAEREGAELVAEGGRRLLDTGKVKAKVFPAFDEAQRWATTNAKKIRSLQMYRLRDGRYVADFVPQNEKVLFQRDETGDINREISGLQKRLMSIMPEEQRSRIAQRLFDLEERRRTVAAPATSLEPLPGKVVRLWTPEGEEAVVPPPLEVKRAETQPVRTAANEPARLPEPPRFGGVPERPEPSRIPRPEPAPGRPVRAGRGTEEPRVVGGQPTGTLRDVTPIRIDAPDRPSKPPVYSDKDWTDKVKLYELPENAPTPTVGISNNLARMLMGGQRYVVESALSGLDRYNSYVLAMPTGSGKTFQSAAILHHILGEKPDAQVLILTTSRGLIDSKGGFKDVMGDFGIEVQDLDKNGPTGAPGVYAETWAGSGNRPGIETHPWDLVIADEVQEARKWWSSQRGQRMKAMGGNAKKVLYMSATPFHTALEIGHMDKLGLWDKEGYEAWAKQFGVHRDAEGNLAGGNAPLKLTKLRNQLIERGQFMSINKDMNGYSAHFGVVPMDGTTKQGLANIKEAMQLAENYFYAANKRGKVQPTRAQAVTLAKRWLEYSRLPQAIDLGKKLEAQGWKVIFFSENKKEFEDVFEFLQEADEGTGGRISQLLPRFPSVTDVLKQHFGDDIGIFAGKHSAARQEELTGFNEGDKKHIYATYGAGGVGVSLHDTVGNAPRAVIYLGPPWSGISFDQALGRPWRYGTRSNVRAYFLFSNAQAEMDVVTNKVAPRMESLRALVSGVHLTDPLVKALRDVPENREATLDYELGNEHRSDIDQFTKTGDVRTVTSYSELPVVSANEAKNKGMKLPGGDGATAPNVVRLFQGGAEDEVLPIEQEHPNLQVARNINVEFAERFIATGAARDWKRHEI